jgi:5-hydroxyisourate hydrolase
VTLSTHVLDATTGRPAAGVAVLLERRGQDGTWTQAASDRTDADGRLRLLSESPGAGESGGASESGGEPGTGVWRITFGSGDYFASRGVATFYPEVTVTFEVSSAAEHHHVPLLLSPFAYSTYRGS